MIIEEHGGIEHTTHSGTNKGVIRSLLKLSETLVSKKCTQSAADFIRS